MCPPACWHAQNEPVLQQSTFCVELNDSQSTHTNPIAFFFFFSVFLWMWTFYVILTLESLEFVPEFAALSDQQPSGLSAQYSYYLWSQEMSRVTHSVSHTHTPERAAQLSSVALSRFPPEIRKSSRGGKIRQGFLLSLKDRKSVV